VLEAQGLRGRLFLSTAEGHFLFQVLITGTLSRRAPVLALRTARPRACRARRSQHQDRTVVDRSINDTCCFTRSSRGPNHAESCTHIKTRQRFSAFLLNMIQRARSYGPTSDTSKKSSLLRTKSLIKTHRLDMFCDTLSDPGAHVLLSPTCMTVRRAA
jgi:hypothetical protein